MSRSYILNFFLFSFFFSLYLQAQDLELIGTIEPEGMDPIDIKLNFKLDESGRVDGISITDFYGADQTVSKIEGSLNEDRRLLSFRETSNVNTQSSASASRFCFIEVKDLPIDLNDDKSILEGEFIGEFKDGSLCASGMIHLIGANFLENLDLDEPATTTPTASNGENVVSEPETVQPLTKLDPTQPLRHGSRTPLQWHSSAVILELWDSFEEDGDRVSIMLNGESVAENIMIRETKQRFNLPVSSFPCTVKIMATNEGSNPPCTVYLHLLDGDKVQATVVKLRQGEFVTLDLLQP